MGVAGTCRGKKCPFTTNYVQNRQDIVMVNVRDTKN